MQRIFPSCWKFRHYFRRVRPLQLYLLFVALFFTLYKMAVSILLYLSVALVYVNEIMYLYIFVNIRGCFCKSFP